MGLYQRLALLLVWPIDFILDILQGFFLKHKTNRFLSNNYAPVRSEISGENLRVVGKIPADLSGEFVRNGPNPVYVPRGGYHWFDGDGMLHGVRIIEGRVNYFNRWVRTGRFVTERSAGRAVFVRLGELWGILGLIKIMFARLKQKLCIYNMEGGTNNTAVVFHSGRLLALVESALPWHIQMSHDGQLQSIGEYSYAGKLKHPFTAHPKVDPETGEMIFFGYQIHKRPFCTFSLVDNTGVLVRSVDAGVRKPVMMHDCAITKHFTLMLDYPLQFRPDAMVRGGVVFKFNASEASRIHVFPRYATHASDGTVFHFPAGFGFHSVNAWEEGEEVVLLMCYAKSFQMEQVGAGSEDAWAGGDYPVIHQFRMNMHTKASSVRPVFDQPCEFPVVSPNFLGRKHKYCYVAAMQKMETRTANFRFDACVKVDVSPLWGGSDTSVCKEAGRIVFGENKYGGEFVFVPRTGSTGEDDGYLIGFVFDEARDSSEFWVVDAHTMSNTPIARVVLPQRVPYGFHGIWVTEEQIKSQREVVSRK